MRFLITGVGGFLGGHLARHLRAGGHAVVGTTWGSHVSAEFPTFEADLLDLPRLKEVIAETAPDRIIHLGGLSHVGESWQRPADYFQVNVLGTENVLDAAGGCPVLLASSAEVYGLVPEERQPIVEREPVGPRTPYALTKAAAERLTVRAGSVVARCFNLVGPGQSDRFALPAFAGQLAAIRKGERDPILHVGNLTARRDFVHVEDGVSALALLAERGVAGEIYNVASGQAFSIAEALDRLLAVSGVDAKVEEDPARLRPVDMPLLRGDASKIAALGWRAERGLEAALRDLWASVSG